MEQKKIRLLRPDEIECRIGTISEKGLSLLLFMDARAAQNILDESFTSFGWRRTHQEIGGRLYCTVEVWDGEKKQWINKQDVGTESFAEKEKGAASDSFKRACFNWGIGRELYSAPFIWIPADRVSIQYDGKRYTTLERFTIAAMLEDESIDCIITDHPWLDILSNRGGNRLFSDYECFRYELEDFQEKARVLKAGCFLAEFLPAENESNYRYLYQIKEFASQCGLEYYSKVSWKKGSFVSNTGRKAKNSQDIMIFTKGKARCMRLDSKKIKKDGRIHYMSGAAGMLPAMFDVEPVPRNQKIHQSELPVELCEQLIPYLTREGEVILDQFAGSGAVGVAALRLGRRCIMIEKSHEDMEQIRKRVG